jgi:DNA-binding IclR family transcriptional regulator
MADGHNTERIEAVERSLKIVDAVQELDGARVTELANHLGWAPSTVHSHLKTLEHHRYLIKEGDTYNIGLEFLNRGGYARERKQAYRMAEDIVKELADETEERAQFIVEEHGRGIYLHTATGSHAVQVHSRLGRLKNLHNTASGKAILSQLPEERVAEIVDRWGLEATTQNTITDYDELLEELEAVRNRGVSYNREESTMGLHALAVPVTDSYDQVIGSFGISGPSNRFKGDLFEKELPDLLLGAANELELNITYS